MPPCATELASPAEALYSDEVSNVLVLVPPLNEADITGCADLLTITAPVQENVWSLGVTVSPNQRVENWEQYVEEKPGAFKVVSIGDLPQTRARETARSYGFDPEPHFMTIKDGSDLTRIGITLINALKEWEDTDRKTVVCFHSVSALMQYTSTDTVVSFLDTFTEHIDVADALAHYHMDPRIHDEETVNHVRRVVDVTVQYESEQDAWLTGSG